MPKTQEIEILHPDEVPEEKISRNNLLNWKKQKILWSIHER
jgi:hypothetical protein